MDLNVPRRIEIDLNKETKCNLVHRMRERADSNLLIAQKSPTQNDIRYTMDATQHASG
jgi:hypothetical protein